MNTYPTPAEVMTNLHLAPPRAKGAKLLEREVQIIRWLALNDIGPTQICRAMRISYYTVRDIISGRSHNQLEYADPFGAPPQPTT